MASQDWTARERVLWLALLVGGLGLTWWVLQYYIGHGWLMADAHAYWTTGQDGYVPYGVDFGVIDAYLYSPAFAQVISVITWLPWPGFAALWAGLEAAAFLWLLRPLGWFRAGVLLLWCSPELALGTVFGFIAVASVLALTGRPQAWVLPVLTKPSLSVGLLWHVARREWRALAVASLVCATVVLVSIAIDKDMWRAWLAFLADSPQGLDLLLGLRLAIAIAVVWFAGRTDQAWLVPFGLMLATPTVGAVSVVTVLAAVPRLMGRDDPDPHGRITPGPLAERV